MVVQESSPMLEMNTNQSIRFLPIRNETRNKITKIKNNIFAIDAALDAIPPNPNTAAMIATTKKTTVQRNIIVSFKLYGNTNCFLKNHTTT